MLVALCIAQRLECILQRLFRVWAKQQRCQQRGTSPSLRSPPYEPPPQFSLLLHRRVYGLWPWVSVREQYLLGCACGVEDECRGEEGAEHVWEEFIEEGCQKWKGDEHGECCKKQKGAEACWGEENLREEG